MSNALVSVNDGALTFKENGYGRVKTLSAYVCTPDRYVKCRMRGVTAFDVTAKGLNDFSTIHFESSKYVTNQSTLVPEVDEAYDLLHEFCLAYVPEFGSQGYFLINTEPQITARGRKDENKSFDAVSYECILQYENLVGFEINQGTTGSLEMFAENLDPLGIPRRMIQLYDPENPRFSLLDLVLRDDYYGWTIGEVDQSLWTKQRSFAVDNQNVYSFLCSDVSTAFRCVFTFDTVNKVINCHDIETVGENTNIYLSLDHFLSEIDIAPRTQEPVSVLRTAGGNDLGIERVNFGSDKVININYPLSMIDPDTRAHYKTYRETIDTMRDQYAEDAKLYADAMQKEAAILDRQPDDAINNNWRSTVYYPTDELRNYLQVYQYAVEAIEGLYTLPGGEIDYVALNASSDAALYHSYKDVCILDIQNELTYRSTGTEYEDVDSDIVWQLYGLNDLELKKRSYEALCEALTEQGYNSEWDPASTISEETWDAHHEEYLTYQSYITQLTALIATKTAEVNALRAEEERLQTEMADLAARSRIDYYVGTLFTQTEADIITSLYREADYQNENILITDIDDEVSTAVKAKELYDDAEARLEIESVPQLTWTVSSANLFAMKEFAPLRDQLQVSSFINLYYGGSLYDPETESFVDRQTLKFRVIEIDFNGINLDNSFTIVFSDMTQTRMYRNDLESLIGSAISSKTNAISGTIASTANAVAQNVAASMIRPYIEILNAKIAEANIDDANIVNLSADNAQIKSLFAHYLSAENLNAIIATIERLNVNYIASQDGRSYWDLKNNVLCLNGYMLNTEVEYNTAATRTTPPASSDAGWSTSMPVPTAAKPYVWMRTKMQLDGDPLPAPTYSAPSCISGEDGEDAVYVQIDSSAGNIFKNGQISSTLTCKVYQGGEDITSRVASFTWTKKDANGRIDESWTKTGSQYSSIVITAADVQSKAIFGCQVTMSQ